MNIRSRFEDDFRNAQTFRLTTNYRSTATIVSAARAVIQQSEIPSALMSWDAIKEGGQDVAVVKLETKEEGAFIATQVKQMLEDAGKKTKSSNSGSSSSIDILEGLRKKRYRGFVSHKHASSRIGGSVCTSGRAARRRR